MPVAQRVLGSNDDTTLMIRRLYAAALYEDPGATLDDLRDAVSTLEDAERIARRVLGGAYPLTRWIEKDLRKSQDALAMFKMTAPGRGTTRAGDVRALREAVAAMSTTSGTK